MNSYELSAAMSLFSVQSISGDRQLTSILIVPILGGRYCTLHGWAMGDGRWPMADDRGHWANEYEGSKPTSHTHWPLAIAHWSLSIRQWSQESGLTTSILRNYLYRNIKIMTHDSDDS